MSSREDQHGDFIGLDLGDIRVGVARINTYARIAEPLAAINLLESELITELRKLVEAYNASGVIVGLPRGLDGQENEQTTKIRAQAREIALEITVPVYIIDEAATTKEAEKRQASYPHASIDSLAATIFLEDFMNVLNRKELRVDR